MNRTELSRPVLVTGPSFLGLETTCTLEPVGHPGIYVKPPTGDAVPLSQMTLGVNRLFRFLTLRWNESILRIPEHLLGLIFNLGLDGVLIIPQAFRLPYDGRATIFWDAIRPALRQSGDLDWLTVPTPLAVTASPDRYIKIFPAEHGCQTFKFDINVPSRSLLIPTRPRRLCLRNFVGIAYSICSPRSWPCAHQGQELLD